MIDSTILELSRSKHEYAQMASTIEGDPGALLFVTFFADTPDEAGAQLDRCRRRGASTATATTSCAPRPPPSRTR